MIEVKGLLISTKQVRLFLNENRFIDPRVTTTSPHPKYQNNNIDNNQMKMSKFDLTES